MPLRDHFRPPIWNHSSWEGLHGGWPITIVQQLSKVLPRDYTAEPRVHLGDYYEIDVCAFEEDDGRKEPMSAGESEVSDGGSEAVATAVYAPPEPTFVLDAELEDQYEYEVLVFDQTRNRQLVAAIEIVSPANKDRPENRHVFVAKCAALLQVVVGHKLPTLPIWLSDDVAVSFDLETSYEETCSVLRIPGG